MTDTGTNTAGMGETPETQWESLRALQSVERDRTRMAANRLRAPVWYWAQMALGQLIGQIMMFVTIGGLAAGTFTTAVMWSMLAASAVGLTILLVAVGSYRRHLDGVRYSAGTGLRGPGGPCAALGLCASMAGNVLIVVMALFGAPIAAAVFVAVTSSGLFGWSGRLSENARLRALAVNGGAR